MGHDLRRTKKKITHHLPLKIKLVDKNIYALRVYLCQFTEVR